MIKIDPRFLQRTFLDRDHRFRLMERGDGLIEFRLGGILFRDQFLGSLRGDACQLEGGACVGQVAFGLRNARLENGGIDLGDHLPRLHRRIEIDEQFLNVTRNLAANLHVVAQELKHVEARAPQVVESYRSRLSERLNKLLAELGVTVAATDVIREVGLFAERCDISEEIVRLRSHLDQFDAVMRTEETPGRKLEFITQEMVRETNTIGSKANDAEIARHVIEIKSVIERIREMIQNVE